MWENTASVSGKYEHSFELFDQLSLKRDLNFSEHNSTHRNEFHDARGLYMRGVCAHLLKVALKLSSA